MHGGHVPHGTGQCTYFKKPELCPDCFAEGEQFEDVAPEDKCCAKLVPIKVAFPEGEGCTQPNCPCFVCTKCGNGLCGEGENWCNCPNDCEGPEPSQCQELGGLCTIPLPDMGDGCPGDMHKEFHPGCQEDEICCLEGGPNCVPAGQTTPVIPNAPECCPGLEKVPMAEYNPEDAICMELDGAALCTDCGNGNCEEWENPCICKEDCGQVEPGNCNTVTNNCPAGLYCKAPAGKCGPLGIGGQCFVVPGVCPGIYAPVCGCNGKSYGNECEMEAAMVSKDHDGECGAECIPLGGKFNGGDMIKCCEGLEAMPDCFFDDGGECTCLKCLCFVCLPCGDKKCSAAENSCNCPEDCLP
jgi:hypothetical protein